MFRSLFVLTLLLLVYFSNAHSVLWGFYGHKLINKLAVYTLPDPMIPFFIKHVNYLSTHAVDPDSRRYISEYEGIRHYMDMESWSSGMDSIPESWMQMLSEQTVIYGITQGDTIPILFRFNRDSLSLAGNTIEFELDSFEVFINDRIARHVFRDDKRLTRHDFWSPMDSLLPTADVYFFKVNYLEHGILPYNLQAYQYKLTKAFEAHDLNKVLRYAADIGHYIGDAHVPLHTTINYNGQLTNQIGIHAFWESRIPELLAEGTFDLLTEDAFYVHDTRKWYWEMVYDSHEQVDSVLALEKQAASSISRDRQYVISNRNHRLQRMQTVSFTTMYDSLMHHMVERQMKKAITAVSSAWMTAWVNAGQPDLSGLKSSDRSKKDDGSEKEVIEGKKSKKIATRLIRGH